MTTLIRTYRPRGTAREAMESRVPELLIAGPAGTGKSRACLEKMHTMCLINPGMRALIVRKTLTSLGSTALVTYREHVAKESIAVGHVAYYGGSSQESAQYRYSNGSSIVIGGMDRATRVMSAEYDLIYVQEATELHEEDWEALLTRLRNGVVSFQQLIADCNPSTPTHWLKARADRGKVVMLNSAHRENPRLFDDSSTLTEQGTAYMANLDALTGVRRQRLRDGLWSAAEGIIYESWRPEDHLIDQFEIPAAWPRYWAIDWGFTNPFVLQCWAETPDGALILYREIYHTQRTVDVHADTIMSIVAPGGRVDDGVYVGGEWIEPKPSFIVADHDAGDRAAFTKRTRLHTTPAMKTVDIGIQAVQRRLADGPAPRLMIMRDAVVQQDAALLDAKKPTCTADEIPGYIWDVGVGQAIKETPLKKDDHGCDAKRYLVAQKDLQGKYRVRFLG